MVRIGKVKDGILEIRYLIVHLVSFDMRFEYREIVDGAFTMRRCNYIGGVLPNVLRNFAPRSFDCRDGICESAILVI